MTTPSTITDRDEIERLIATEAILPGEDVNDKAKRILAHYGWEFVFGSSCNCDLNDNKHTLSCGYWPNGIIPKMIIQPNDIQIYLSPTESELVAWALQMLDNMSNTERSSLRINDITFSFRGLIDKKKGILTIPNHKYLLGELEYRLRIQLGSESTWKRIEEAVKDAR